MDHIETSLLLAVTDAFVWGLPCSPYSNDIVVIRFISVWQNTWWVWLLNVLFTLLAMFHLAYLGLMFKSEPDMQEFDYQVRTM